MNIDFLHTISVSLFIIGIVLLIIAVLLFIRWKVPFLIAEVSGANSRKEIARIQRDSEEGRHTSGMHMTAKIVTQMIPTLDAEETTVLTETSSSRESGKTSSLDDIGSETTVLTESVIQDNMQSSIQNSIKQEFRVEYEIGFSEGKGIIE